MARIQELAKQVASDKITSVPADYRLGLEEWKKTFTASEERWEIKAEVYPIDPLMAELMLETMPFSRQRNIMPKHVEYLIKAIQDSELTNLIIVLGEFPDGNQILIDGYHRLKALLATGVTMKSAVITFQVDDTEQLANQYAKIDRPAIRRAQDMLRAFGVDADEKLSPHMRRAMAPATNLLEGNFSKGSSTGAKSLIGVTHHVEQWLPEGLLYNECLKTADPATRSMMIRAAVVAVALATLKHKPALAMDFWGSVAAQDALPKDSPQMTLLKFLRNNTVGRPVPYARYVATAWNAFYEGRSITVLKTYGPDGPVNIKGTPFTGKD